ncbi:MAG: YebC/PmpR family DNA-binding transcriptional regulator [Candidatus Buchananbacteria bacterium]
MSGHSKWATTKRAKGAADAKRGAIFTKLGNNISIAAKLGGGDPATNFRLRLAIDLAKASNVPKDNIERAIKRGTGELGGGIIETVVYEGFGPEGSALIIEGLTDNRNRTAAAVKHILSKHGGSLGGPNAVSWLFEQKAVIRTKDVSDDLELELIDAGALDIVREDEGATIYAAPNDLKKVKDFLDTKNMSVDYAEIEQVPKEKKTLSAEGNEKINKLFAELDEDADVSNYYSNVADE